MFCCCGVDDAEAVAAIRQRTRTRTRSRALSERSRTGTGSLANVGQAQAALASHDGHVLACFPRKDACKIMSGTVMEVVPRAGGEKDLQVMRSLTLWRHKLVVEVAPGGLNTGFTGELLFSGKEFMALRGEVPGSFVVTCEETPDGVPEQAWTFVTNADAARQWLTSLQRTMSTFTSRVLRKSLGRFDKYLKVIIAEGEAVASKQMSTRFDTPLGRGSMDAPSPRGVADLDGLAGDHDDNEPPPAFGSRSRDQVLAETMIWHWLYAPLSHASRTTIVEVLMERFHYLCPSITMRDEASFRDLFECLKLAYTSELLMGILLWGDFELWVDTVESHEEVARLTELSEILGERRSSAPMGRAPSFTSLASFLRKVISSGHGPTGSKDVLMERFGELEAKQSSLRFAMVEDVESDGRGRASARVAGPKLAFACLRDRDDLLRLVDEGTCFYIMFTSLLRQGRCDDAAEFIAVHNRLDPESLARLLTDGIQAPSARWQGRTDTLHFLDTIFEQPDDIVVLRFLSTFHDWDLLTEASLVRILRHTIQFPRGPRRIATVLEPFLKTMVLLDSKTFRCAAYCVLQSVLTLDLTRPSVAIARIVVLTMGAAQGSAVAYTRSLQAQDQEKWPPRTVERLRQLFEPSSFLIQHMDGITRYVDLSPAELLARESLFTSGEFWVQEQLDEVVLGLFATLLQPWSSAEWVPKTLFDLATRYQALLFGRADEGGGSFSPNSAFRRELVRGYFTREPVVVKKAFRELVVAKELLDGPLFFHPDYLAPRSFDAAGGLLVDWNGHDDNQDYVDAVRVALKLHCGENARTEVLAIMNAVVGAGHLKTVGLRLVVDQMLDRPVQDFYIEGTEDLSSVSLGDILEMVELMGEAMDLAGRTEAVYMLQNSFRYILEETAPGTWLAQFRASSSAALSLHYLADENHAKVFEAYLAANAAAPAICEHIRDVQCFFQEPLVAAGDFDNALRSFASERNSRKAPAPRGGKGEMVEEDEGFDDDASIFTATISVSGSESHNGSTRITRSHSPGLPSTASGTTSVATSLTARSHSERSAASQAAGSTSRTLGDIMIERLLNDAEERYRRWDTVVGCAVEATARSMQAAQDRYGAVIPPRQVQTLGVLLFSRFMEQVQTPDSPAPRMCMAELGNDEQGDFLLAMLAAVLVKAHGVRVHILSGSESAMRGAHALQGEFLRSFVKGKGPRISTAIGVVDPGVDVCYVVRDHLAEFSRTIVGLGSESVRDTVLLVAGADDVLFAPEAGQFLTTTDPARSRDLQRCFAEIHAGEEVTGDGKIAAEAAKAADLARSWKQGVDYDIVDGMAFALGPPPRRRVLRNETPLALEFLRAGLDAAYEPVCTSPSYCASLAFMLKKYDAVFGFVDALGGGAERRFLTSMYGATTFVMPPFLETCRGVQKLRPICRELQVLASANAHAAAVADNAALAAVTVPVLVVCPSADVAQRIHEALVRLPTLQRSRLQLFLDEEAKRSSWLSLARPDTDGEWRISVATSEALQTRALPFADAGSREQGGLMVLLTSAPATAREWAKWKALTARQDQPGQYMVFLQRAEDVLQRPAVASWLEEDSAHSLGRGGGDPPLLDAILQACEETTAEALTKVEEQQKAGMALHGFCEEHCGRFSGIRAPFPRTAQDLALRDLLESTAADMPSEEDLRKTLEAIRASPLWQDAVATPL